MLTMKTQAILDSVLSEPRMEFCPRSAGARALFIICR